MKKNVLIFIITSILFGCEEEKENGWVGAYVGEANYTDFNGRSYSNRKCTLTFFGSADNNNYRILLEGPIDFDTKAELTSETSLNIEVPGAIGSIILRGNRTEDIITGKCTQETFSVTKILKEEMSFTMEKVN